VLNLDYTGVTDRGLEALMPLTRLAHLKLDSAAVTDAGVEHLKKLPALKSVNLYHTLVTDTGFTALKSELPECRVVWVRESALPTRRGS
jgi:hypothetical protein